MRLVSIPSDSWQRECILFRSSELFSLCFIRDEIRSTSFFLLSTSGSGVTCGPAEKTYFFHVFFFKFPTFFFSDLSSVDHIFICLKFIWWWQKFFRSSANFSTYSIPFSLSPPPSISLSRSSPAPGISIILVVFSLGQSRWTAALSSSIKFSSRHCPTSKEKEVCDPLLFTHTNPFAPVVANLPHRNQQTLVYLRTVLECDLHPIYGKLRHCSCVI